MEQLKEFSRTAMAYMVASIAIFLMIRLTTQYTSFETDVAFLSLKQDYLENDLWLLSFYIHVFSTTFCLLAALTQFSKYLLGHYPKVHRIMGKAYVLNILFINFPVAFVMAIYANGGLPSKAAFIILDCLWFWFTLKAWLLIKEGKVAAHRNFMIRSFALTFSAITLRTWKGILTTVTDLDLETIYMIDAWLGFVPNLFAAEYIIYRIRKRARSSKNKKSIQPNIF